MEARNLVKRTLYHPDDIKNVGLNQFQPSSVPFTLPRDMPSPMAPATSRPTSTRSGLSSVTPPGAHLRTRSLGSGSLGRVEAQRLHAQTELGRYVEDEDDEDYDDMFAGSVEHGLYRSAGSMDKGLWIRSFTLKFKYSYTEHKAFEQFMGRRLVLTTYAV